MKLLKASVIIMGVLILAGLTVIIVVIISRYGGDKAPGNSPATSPANLSSSLSAPVARGFGERAIAIPMGAETVETRLDGSRLVVRLRLADGATALLFLDSTTGERLGLVRLDPR
jgi:hypothetical protein